MYEVHPTKRYNKDLKRIAYDRELINEMYAVIALLSADDNPLPETYRDHPLKGQYEGYRECHIRPDWLLVYQKKKEKLILLLVRTGTHSHIFG